VVLGINRRNALIARENPRDAIRLVRDKVATKQRLAHHGVRVPPTLALLERLDELVGMRWETLPTGWVMKPRSGSRGRGVLVVPTMLPADRCATHARAIVEGDFTDGRPDGALLEPLLVADQELRALAPHGLPDVRVVVWRGEALLAMARLPTIASGGRGNLHQGGIGAAIDLGSGVLTRAVHGRSVITRHPDTGALIVGRRVPGWSEVLRFAIAAAAATRLGYAGVDLVIDEHAGPLVLEVNGHPGLEIQNVCDRPLIQASYRRAS
jgi:alpha-L-glutamate ligase-like protein